MKERIPMKITAYEVRPDEKITCLPQPAGADRDYTGAGPMTQDNIDRAEGGRHYDSWRYKDGRRID